MVKILSRKKSEWDGVNVKKMIIWPKPKTESSQYAKDNIRKNDIIAIRYSQENDGFSFTPEL